MATGAGRKDARDAKERQRLYEARRRFHAGVVARRRRDNVIAGVAGGALILAIGAAQFAYFTVGPGVPEPAATETPAPTETSIPSETPAPTDGATTPAESPSPTP